MLMPLLHRRLIPRAPLAALLIAGLAAAPAAHAQSTGTPAASRPTPVGLITGTVIDQGTRQPLADVQVAVTGTSLTAVTDANGRFRLANVPVGTRTLRLARIGYAPRSVTDLLVNPGRPTQTAVALDPAATQISDVRIVAGGSTTDAPRTMPNSRITMSYEEIRRSPGAVGDVSRLVQAMPGVVPGSDDSRNDIIARGGSPMENLMLIDGIEVPNINHFAGQGTTGGPIGMINTELVRDATFMAGGFGPRFGNRLSSVLDIALREGNGDRWRSEIDVSTAGAGLIGEGPLGQKGTLILSARQSFLDLLAPALGLTAVPYTTNFQLKAAFRPDARNEVKLIGLGGFDRIDFVSRADDPEDGDPPGTTRVRGDRWTGGASWQRLLGSRGVGTLVTSLTSSGNNVRVIELALGETPVFRNRARELEYVVRYDAQLAFPGVVDVAAGASARRLTLGSRLASPFGVNNPYSASPGRVDTVEIDASTSADIGGAYVEFSRTLGRLDLAASSRVDHFALAAATRLSPRATATVRLTDGLALSGTWARYHQQVPLVYSANVAANRTLAPMRADHGVVALRWTPRSDLLVSVEGFDRRYTDYPVAEAYPQLSLANTGDQVSIDALIFPMRSAGTGRSRGVELFAQQKFTGSLYGQVSYTRSRVEHRALDGIWRAGGYDTPNIFTAILGAKRGTAWEFSTRGSYTSGRPRTPVDLVASTAQNRLVFDAARLNSERTPVFARLDVRVDRRFAVGRTWLSMFFEIQNITNRQNRVVEEWNAKTNAVEWRQQVALLPLIGLNWKY
jgi:hypothetical protein